MSVETKEAVMEGKVKHWIRISCAAAAVTGASAVLMVAGLLRKDAPLFFGGPIGVLAGISGLEFARLKADLAIQQLKALIRNSSSAKP